MATKPIMWTLEEALSLVRELQPKLHLIQYHVTLGGGTLNCGYSRKDLDLFIIPFDSGSPHKVIAVLKDVLGESRPMTTDTNYAESPVHKDKLIFDFCNKRIDVFIL